MNKPLADQATIKLTPKEEQEIHDLWKNKGFQILVNSLLKQRQKNLSMVGMSEAVDFEQVREYRGRIFEGTWIVEEVHRIFKKINNEEDD